MVSLADMPAVNAALNAIAAALLGTGYILIRRGRREAHKKAMLTACAVSLLFFCCYLVYHSQVGSVRFQKTGPVRTLYFSVLLTHTLLAVSVPVLAILTLRRAFQGNFDRHRRLARWTLPIWLYVSITGVAVYWMLYRM